MKKIATVIMLLFLALPFSLFASEEGTRHITGEGKNIYFMNDRVFGTIDGHPLWADYTCGSEINGKIDINNTYHSFTLRYRKGGDFIADGTFGPMKLALEKIERKGQKTLFHILLDDKEYIFSIRYERFQEGHMINSIIEGKDGKGRPVKLSVDGRLCPFATSGIILIVVGAVTLSAA
jgi:hypothetical protein